MAEPRSTSAFPLRLRSPRLRALLREVAAREHISQNELIEQALDHELSLRGARLAEDLAAAADRLARLSDGAHVLRHGEAEAGRRRLRQSGTDVDGPAPAYRGDHGTAALVFAGMLARAITAIP